MSNSKLVYVRKHPETGDIFTEGRTQGWGSIRVETKPALVSTNGVMSFRKRVAFPRMQKEVFEQMDLKDGSTLQGKIIWKTSTEPQYEGHEPKINPTTKEIITNEFGEPVYMTQEFTTDLKAEDINLDTVVGEEELSEEEQKESQAL